MLPFRGLGLVRFKKKKEINAFMNLFFQMNAVLMNFPCIMFFLYEAAQLYYGSNKKCFLRPNRHIRMISEPCETDPCETDPCETEE